MEKYTNVELMICMAARLVEDERTVFVGYGMPQIAAILAQRLYAPNIIQVYEYGAVGPEVATPFRRNMMADARNSYRALAWTTMNPIMWMASAGYIDYGFLGAAQLDPYGNINSTMIGGTYERPGRRFTGSGGGNEVASLCLRTVILMRHQKRKFVEKVEFITSPGYLDGSPGARERAGLPRDGGPYRVVTDKAIFDYDEETRRMRLIGLAPGTTVDGVLAEMGFEPLVAPADELMLMEPPRLAELEMLREDIDPDRVIIGRVG